MTNAINFEALGSLTNIAIILLGAGAVVFVLRGVFKVAWNVIKVILILVGLLIIIGYFAGWLNIVFL